MAVCAAQDKAILPGLWLAFGWPSDKGSHVWWLLTRKCIRRFCVWLFAWCHLYIRSTDPSSLKRPYRPSRTAPSACNLLCVSPRIMYCIRWMYYTHIAGHPLVSPSLPPWTTPRMVWGGGSSRCAVPSTGTDFSRSRSTFSSRAEACFRSFACPLVLLSFCLLPSYPLRTSPLACPAMFRPGLCGAHWPLAGRLSNAIGGAHIPSMVSAVSSSFGRCHLRDTQPGEIPRRRHMGGSIRAGGGGEGAHEKKEDRTPPVAARTELPWEKGQHRWRADKQTLARARPA